MILLAYILDINSHYAGLDYSKKLGQYHGCWCPGALSHQIINNHDTDFLPILFAFFRANLKNIWCFTVDE